MRRHPRVPAVSANAGRQFPGTYAFEVEDDLNLPLLRKGDIVLVDPDDRDLAREGLFAFLDEDDGSESVTYIQPRGDKIRVLLCNGDDTLECYPSDLVVIGRVMTRGRVKARAAL